jgi:hypothetical protein
MRPDCRSAGRIVFFLSLLYYLLVHEVLLLKEWGMKICESFSRSLHQQHTIGKEDSV